MKIKPSTRTRLIGYFGIAVTTLLTPGGKLISSALAAATVVGLVTMNTPTRDEKTRNSAVSIAYTGTESTENSLLNVSGLSLTGTASDTLTPEALASDQYAAQEYVPQENQAGFTAQSLPAANLVTLNTNNPNTSNAPNGFGVPSSPPLGPKPGPKFTPGPGVAALPDGVLPEIKNRAAPDGALNPPPMVSSIPINDPKVLAPKELAPDLPKGPEDDAPSSSPPRFALAPDPDQRIQPLLAIAQISEPPTLAMLLLGLTGLGWLSRRKQPLSMGPAI